MELSDGDKQRFWGKVNKTETCWLWTAHCNRWGHGQFKFNEKMHKAHRISWFIAGNTIPEGHIIRHKCRAANCVNPAHLETGTIAQNNADKIRDGTSTRGTKNPSSKLTEAQVLEIFVSDKTQSAIAEEYGITQTTVWRIKHGRRWGWLTTLNPPQR